MHSPKVRNLPPEITFSIVCELLIDMHGRHQIKQDFGQHASTLSVKNLPNFLQLWVIYAFMLTFYIMLWVH